MIYDIWQLAGSVLTTHFSHHRSSYMSKHFSALCTKVKLKLTLYTQQPSFCPPTSFPAHGSLNLQPSIFSHLIYTHVLPLNGAGRPLSYTYLTRQSFVFALIQHCGTVCAYTYAHILKMGVKNSNLNSLRFPQNATQASLFRQIFFYTVSLLYYFLFFFI